MHPDDPQVRASEVPPESRSAVPRTVIRLAVAGVIVASIVLRFVTRSPLWLDEALTVDIAREPLSKIPGLLRDDGAPPLYYFLLHFWMKIAGQGDLGTRSLAGIIGVINLPVAWLAGFRVGARWWTLPEVTDDAERARRVARGNVTGWAATLLLATSPFAIYYDTEARMYGLVLLFGTIGVVSITSILRRPTWWSAFGLAVLTSASLYTHYWAIYLAGVTGVGALWCAVRGPYQPASRLIAGALAVGGISFLPWVPTFLFQLHHTGTPWGQAAQFTAVVNAFTQMAGGTSTMARALTLFFFFLLVLALFGAAVDGRHVELDLHTRPGIRLVAAAVLVTLVVAIVAALISGSTFADRYTAIIVFPALLMVAYGFTTLADVRLRGGVLAVMVVFGLVASLSNATHLRTQAGQVAAAITAHGRPGDVIAYCPDQLGPSVSRLVTGPYEQVTFPRDDPPQIVDWVNYEAAVKRASPYAFAQRVRYLADGHAIWYVMAPAYQGFGNDCADVGIDLAHMGLHETNYVSPMDVKDPFEIFEGMSVDRFSHVASSASPR